MCVCVCVCMKLLYIYLETVKTGKVGKKITHYRREKGR
jgi:hypothetical protein